MKFLGIVGIFFLRPFEGGCCPPNPMAETGVIVGLFVLPTHLNHPKPYIITRESFSPEFFTG